MSVRGHIQTLCAATAAWAAFWAIGLPSYYRQYSTATMVIVCVVLLPPVIAVSYALLRRTKDDRRVARASWLAFYFTFPLALYDWLYCGVYLGFGMNFLREFWYLTAYYIVPWVVLPATAIVLNRSGVRDVRSAATA